MQKVHILITNSGDGSNFLNWFKNLSETEIKQLKNIDEITGDYETFGSGDGVQVSEVTFPDSLDLDTIGVYWTVVSDMLEDYKR